MPRRSSKKKRTTVNKSRKAMVKRSKRTLAGERYRTQKRRERMREMMWRYGYTPLSEMPEHESDPTCSYTRREIMEWRDGFSPRSGMHDPFAATDLEKYKPVAGDAEQSRPKAYELYGVMGDEHAFAVYFGSPAYQLPFSRKTCAGQRSDKDCFGTSLLTLMYLRQFVKCPVPALGVTNVETVQPEQVVEFLEKQRGIEIFPMVTDSVWRHKWTRKKGRRLLGDYLESAREILKIDCPPLSDMLPGQSFAFILGVWQAEADIAHSDVRGIGHWYIVQARRDHVFSELRWTVHANTDPLEGSPKSSWDEPSLFGLLTSFDVCQEALPGSYPEGVLQEYRDSRMRAGKYFDVENYQKLFGDVDVRMELPAFISVLWWAPCPVPGLRRVISALT